MRFHEFDLNLLVYLDALLTEVNVSRAAAKVSISQPAMSTALARLREYYKDDLLVRITQRKMALTPLAESLVGPVSNALLQVQSIANATGHFDPSTSNRKFVIMAPIHISDIFLKPLIARLRYEAPGVQLEIQAMTIENREQLRRAEIDLLITPDGLALEDLPTEVLWEDRVVCIVWSENKLVGDVLSLEQYLSMGHVGTRFQGYIEESLNQIGAVRRVEVIVPELPMMPRLVQGTDLISTIHMRLAHVYAQPFGLRLVRPPVEFPHLREVMQWRALQETDPVFLWFREIVRSVAKEMPPLNIDARTEQFFLRKEGNLSLARRRAGQRTRTPNEV